MPVVEKCIWKVQRNVPRRMSWTTRMAKATQSLLSLKRETYCKGKLLLIFVHVYIGLYEIFLWLSTGTHQAWSPGQRAKDTQRSHHHKKEARMALLCCLHHCEHKEQRGPWISEKTWSINVLCSWSKKIQTICLTQRDNDLHERYSLLCMCFY